MNKENVSMMALERNRRSFLATVVVLGFVGFMALLMFAFFSRPMSSSFDCDVDIRWLENQGCYVGDEWFIHCPLPESMKCSGNVQMPVGLLWAAVS